ncbi:MAG TPA: alpha/beta hydrolase [Lachnospiraceae bacterium]|nr:alpha/beta hydrolase [Lachnospiraceae bacterium]
MRIEKVVFPGGASLTGYLRDTSKEMPGFDRRPAVILCPGGAYRFCSARESDPVALRFFGAGYQVFTLIYSTGKRARNWQPMIELSKSILYLREHAEKLGVIENKIAVCGFSAGGHLACSAGVLWDAPAVQAATPAPHGENRPDAIILGYPVITSGKYTHRESMDNITGGDPGLEAAFSLENQVKAGTPPMFLWHTVADETVPVENSMLLAEALQKNKVPFELHLFPEGGHGSSVCTDEVGSRNDHNARWMDLCLEWLRQLFAF